MEDLKAKLKTVIKRTVGEIVCLWREQFSNMDFGEVALISSGLFEEGITNARIDSFTHSNYKWGSFNTKHNRDTDIAIIEESKIKTSSQKSLENKPTDLTSNLRHIGTRG